MSTRFVPQGLAGQAAAVHQQGMALWRAGRLDEALPCFQQALALKEQLGDLAAAASSIHMRNVSMTLRHRAHAY